MGAYSIADRIGGWIADELEAESTVSGEEFGYSLTMVPAQGPRGEAIFWVILVTLRSPYLGQDAIGCTGRIQANVPAESAVRQQVRSSAAKLRESFEARKQAGFTKGNGHNQGGLPDALKGLRLG